MEQTPSLVDGAEVTMEQFDSLLADQYERLVQTFDRQMNAILPDVWPTSDQALLPICDRVMGSGAEAL